MSEAVQRRQHECPFCGSAAVVRTSRRLSALYIAGIIECDNIEECGWRGRYDIEIVGTLTPSAVAHKAAVTLNQIAYGLPLLPSTRKRLPLTKNPNDPNRDQADLFPTLH